MGADDRAVVEKAVPHYLRGWQVCAQRTTGRRNKAYAAFEGPTADDIMRRHGIRFDDDRARYLRVERAIREAAARRVA